MATRRYCDHCGNTIKTPNVFSYGPFRMIEMYHSQQIQTMQQAVALQHIWQNSQGQRQLGNLAGANSPPPTQGPPAKSHILEKYQTIDVDLCDHCVPLWMERVRQITAQSDPEEKK